MRDKIDEKILHWWEESKAQVLPEEIEDTLLEVEMILEARNRYEEVKRRRFDATFREMFGDERNPQT